MSSKKLKIANILLSPTLHFFENDNIFFPLIINNRCFCKTFHILLLCLLFVYVFCVLGIGECIYLRIQGRTQIFVLSFFGYFYICYCCYCCFCMCLYVFVCVFACVWDIGGCIYLRIQGRMQIFVFVFLG